MKIVLLTLFSLGIPFIIILICNAIEVVAYANKKRIKTPSIIQWLCTFMFIFSVIALLCEFVLVVEAKTGRTKKRKYYENWCCLIERVAEVNGTDEDTIKEAMEYNYNVKIHQYYLNSSWTNWFASEIIASQPLIDIDRLVYKGEKA